MIPNYLMAQVPTYPTMLLFPPPDVPGDFGDEDETKQRNRSDLLADAILFDRLNEDRSKKSAGQASGDQPSLMSDDMSGFVSPYANPYYAQQQQDRQQQGTLKQAKDAWDWYRRYQDWFGGGTAAPAGGNNAAAYWNAGDFASFELPQAGSTSLGGLAGGGLMAVPGGAGWGTAAGGAAFDAGVMAVPGGLSNAAVGSGAASGSGAGAAAGGAAMGGLAGLAGLGLFALLAYNHAEKTHKKDVAEREAGLPAWEAGEGRHITRLKTDDERLDWYHQMYG